MHRTMYILRHTRRAPPGDVRSLQPAMLCEVFPRLEFACVNGCVFLARILGLPTDWHDAFDDVAPFVDAVLVHAAMDLRSTPR